MNKFKEIFTNTKSFIYNNKFSILFLFFQSAGLYFLFSDSYNEDIDKRIISNTLFFILNILLITNIRGLTRKIYLSFLYLISIVPNLTVLGFYFMNNWIMKSTDFWVIFDSNPTESANFLDTLPIKAFIGTIIYFLSITYLLILSYKEVKKQKNRKLEFLLYIIPLIVSISLPFRAHLPFVDFYKSFYNYQKDKKELIEFINNRNNIHINTSTIYNENPKTIVVVIGESANRNHYGIYGYERNTTPHLDSIKSELSIFNNVVSPGIQTLDCLQKILTFSTYHQPDLYKKESNIIELANNSSFKTFWIDNQGSGGIDTYTPSSYRCIAQQSSEFTLFQSLMDEEIIPKYIEILKDSSYNKIIFIHLNGSHFAYHTRYPVKFKYFKDDKVKSKFKSTLTKKQINTINEYDNSILYNDYVLWKIIEPLKNIEGIVNFLYFSDHGEEVYDSSLYAGRSFDNLTKGMCEIPFILWQNKTSKEVQNLKIDTNRPFSTEDVIHSLMDLMGIRYHLYESERSVFSNEFVEKIRYVRNIDYNDIK